MKPGDIQRAIFLKSRGWVTRQSLGVRYYLHKATDETAKSLFEAERIERGREPKPALNPKGNRLLVA